MAAPAQRRKFRIAVGVAAGLGLLTTGLVVAGGRPPALTASTASYRCALGNAGSNASVHLFSSTPIILIQRQDAGIAFFRHDEAMGACTLTVRDGTWVATTSDWSPGVRPTGTLTAAFGGAGLPRLDWTFTGGLTPPGTVRMDAVLPGGAVEAVALHGRAFGAWLETPPNTSHQRDRYPLLRAYGPHGNLMASVRTSP